MRSQQNRKERIPLGIPKKKLDFPHRPGFVRRIIVDRAGRLQDALNAGYQFVTEATLHGDAAPKDLTERESVDSRISRVVGTNEDGSPQRGYLMEIPEELYWEDQRAKQERIDRMESAMRKGQDEGGGPGEDGRYIPRTGIKIEHGSRRR